MKVFRRLVFSLDIAPELPQRSRHAYDGATPGGPLCIRQKSAAYLEDEKPSKLKNKCFTLKSEGCTLKNEGVSRCLHWISRQNLLSAADMLTAGQF